MLLADSAPHDLSPFTHLASIATFLCHVLLPLHLSAPHSCGCLFFSVLEPTMIHCPRQQPLAQTVRTLHLHKPELLGSSLSPISNCSPVHILKPTRGSRCLAAARNSEWFLSFGPTIRHAIAPIPESAATTGYLLLVCRSQGLPFRLV